MKSPIPTIQTTSVAPSPWSEHLSLPRLPVLPELYSGAIRKIGAELFLFEDLCNDAILKKQSVPAIDASSFLDHIHYLNVELEERNLGDDELKALVLNLESSATILKAWCKNLPNSTSADDVFGEIWGRYDKLAQIASFSSFALTGGAPIRFLEFDTELSGIPLAILPGIVKLEEQLVIDPLLKKPQAGFLHAEGIDQLSSALRRRQSRVFAIVNDREVLGFYLPVFSSPSVSEILGKTRDALLSAALINSNDSLGWAEIVGTTNTHKHSFAHKNVNLYSFLDSTIRACAKNEGTSVLVGLVRQGENANVALKSHIRRGWEPTEIFVKGSDGATPYQVITSRIQTSEQAMAFERDLIGYSSKFELHHSSRVLMHSGVENAASPYQPSQAIQACINYFSLSGRSPRILPLPGYYDLSIQIGDGGCDSVHTLRQVRPRTDYWCYESTSQDIPGSLATLLPIVARNL